MISAQLSTSYRYRHCMPGLDKAFDYVAQGGPEAIYYTPAETAPITEDYDPATDLVKYDPDSADSVVVLKEGDFAIFLPEDAHMPGAAFKEPAKVKKIVVKVQLAHQQT